MVSCEKPMNHFGVFEDKPQRYDAWDIDIYYQEKPLNRIKLIKREINKTSNLSHKQRIGGVRSRILLFYDKFKIGSGHSQPAPVQIMIPCCFEPCIRNR